MIFVTVGTHEQQFDRLVSYIDGMKQQGVILEDVIIQTGYCTYFPQYCNYRQWFPYEDMVDNISKARIVVTHGGPSSFILPLQLNKVPVVVPRQSLLGEHVNDHQIKFIKEFSARSGAIIPVFHIDELQSIIINYDSIVETMPLGIRSHNAEFNREFEKIVDEIFSRDKL